MDSQAEFQNLLGASVRPSQDLAESQTLLGALLVLHDKQLVASRMDTLCRFRLDLLPMLLAASPPPQARQARIVPEVCV